MSLRGLTCAFSFLAALAARAEGLPQEAGAAEPALEKEADPCASIRAAIEKRKDYLRRVAAERDSFGWVENHEDAQALRLLQGLRRCAEHPEDEDCKPPPIEQKLEDLEPPRHVYERWPSDLDADGKEPDEIPHDPKVLGLLKELEQCEARKTPQPLLRPRVHPRTSLDRGERRE